MKCLYLTILGVNAQGNLTIGGVDTVALAKKVRNPALCHG